MIEKNWKPQPSQKAEEVDHAITSIFGFDRKEQIKSKKWLRHYSIRRKEIG